VAFGRTPAPLEPVMANTDGVTSSPAHASGYSASCAAVAKQPGAAIAVGYDDLKVIEAQRFLQSIESGAAVCIVQVFRRDRHQRAPCAAREAAAVS